MSSYDEGDFSFYETESSDYEELSDDEEFSDNEDYSELSDEESDVDDCSENPAKRPRLENSQTEWTWKTTDNEPQIKQFTATSGIKPNVLQRLGSDPSALKVFSEVFTEQFWELLAKETNIYAEQIITEGSKKKKIDNEWFQMSVDEMKAYFALSIIMTQVKKPTVQMNWSKRGIIHTPIFAQTMPFRRFLAITRFLHFSNNEFSDKDDKMTKVRSVIDYMNDKFEELYTPEQNVSIDESLMKCKARLGCVVFVRIKRARYGIKFYKLCESESGYCLNFKVYTGQDKNIDKDFNVSETVVRDLSKLIINQGYTLYLDNWYSSPNIFQYLHQHDTNAIGTVRSNRKNMPKDLEATKLKKGEVATRSSKGILAVKWSDRKEVYLLSTMHKNAEMTDTGKRKVEKGGKRAKENTFKPKCVIDYNHGMGGVDHQDQVLACFPVMRKFMKGYRKIFFYLFDMGLFNSYVLYSKMSSKNHYVNYRLDVAEQLLQNLKLPDYKTPGRPAHGDTPSRLQAKHWGHFPRHIPATLKKKNPARVCKVCSKNKKRSETVWECKSCLVALHVPECFERYHTVHDY